MKPVVLLLAIVLPGQLTLAQTGASNQRDYGWQIEEDGELVYIIQISPEKLRMMQPQNGAITGPQEFQSSMPPELIGRVQRVIVRIGSGPLPRSPSLAEIKARRNLLLDPTDVTAALGQGSFQNLESPVVDVQDTGLPRLPIQDRNRGSGSLLDNIADRAKRAGNNLVDSAKGIADSAAGPMTFPNSTGTQSPPSRSDSFLGATRGSDRFAPTTVPRPGIDATSPLPASVPPRSDTSRFDNTGQNPVSPLTRAPAASRADPRTFRDDDPQQWQTTADPAADRWPDRRSVTTSQRSAPAADSPFTTPPSLAANNPRNPGQQRQTPTDNFGNLPGSRAPQTNQGYAHIDPYSQAGRGIIGDNQPGYRQPTYDGGRYAGDGMVATQPPNATRQFAGAPQQPFDRTASNNASSRTRLPAVTAGQDSTTLPGTNSAEEGSTGKSPSDGKQDATSEGTTKSASSVLSILFILSFVVNCYLAWLMSKLLGRYRSLLSSVRSQTA